MMIKILIVEDDVMIAELEKDYLEANDYEVALAFDGVQGVEMAQEDSFDLILLDVMLPKLNGFEVCKEIRKTSDIPILIVSTKGEDADKIKGLGIGADDYIVKPFSPSELVARVTAHLSRYGRLTAKRKDDSDIIKVGEITIDTQAKRVSLRDKELVMTSREYELLLFLATNPDKVFSREDLFNRIWKLDSMGETSTVTVHINRIREKIEDDKNNPKYIETLWGSGYRFKNVKQQ